MVAEGLLSLTKMVDNLNEYTLKGRAFQHVASHRMQTGIEKMLYRMGCVTAPGKRSQERYAAEGKTSPYLVVERDLRESDALDEYTKEQQDLIDAEDAVSVMAASLQLDADLLKPEYINLTSEEVAQRLGMSQATISRRRAKLRSKYKIDFGG